MSIITEIGKTVRNHIGGRVAPGTAKEMPLSANAVSLANAPIPTRKRSRGKSESALASGAATANGQLACSAIATNNGSGVDGSPVPSTKARKSELVLSLLHKEGGASITEIMAATQWQAHSVRAFLSATVRRKLGLDLIINTGEDGSRRYQILTVKISEQEDRETGTGSDAALTVSPPPEDGSWKGVR